MMTESQFTAKLLRALRATGEFEIIWKHNDRVTAGIPDFQTWRSMNWSTCCEVKLIGSPGKMFQPLQLETLKRVRGWYLIWNPRIRRGFLFRADDWKEWTKQTPLTFAEIVERIRGEF
jgi:hypothetical protein